MIPPVPRAIKNRPTIDRTLHARTKISPLQNLSSAYESILVSPNHDSSDNIVFCTQVVMVSQLNKQIKYPNNLKNKLIILISAFHTSQLTKLILSVSRCSEVQWTYRRSKIYGIIFHSYDNKRFQRSIEKKKKKKKGSTFCSFLAWLRADKLFKLGSFLCAFYFPLVFKIPLLA